jgi:hypothetical protein
VLENTPRTQLSLGIRLSPPLQLLPSATTALTEIAPDGTFTFPALFPGTYTVRIGTLQISPATITIEDKDVTGLRIEVRSPQNR